MFNQCCTHASSKSRAPTDMNVISHVCTCPSVVAHHRRSNETLTLHSNMVNIMCVASRVYKVGWKCRSPLDTIDSSRCGRIRDVGHLQQHHDLFVLCLAIRLHDRQSQWRRPYHLGGREVLTHVHGGLPIREQCGAPCRWQDIAMDHPPRSISADPVEK